MLHHPSLILNHHISFLYSTLLKDWRGIWRFRIVLEVCQTKCQVTLQTKTIPQTTFLSVLLSISIHCHSVVSVTHWCWAQAVNAIYSTSWNVLWRHFISHLSLSVPLSYYPSSSLPITLTSLSPSVKQASGSSDSSGSSSTESTPSPGGRISTVLPSDELRRWGSASSFCMDEEGDESTNLHCRAWNDRGLVVIGANLLSWLSLWFSIHMYSSATTVYLSVETRHCNSSQSWAL